MILSHESLVAYAIDNVSPYNSKLIGSCSIDLRLGSFFRDPIDPGYAIDKDTPSDEIWSDPMELTFYTLLPGEMVLCHSLETVTIPDNLCADLLLTSSTGRMGLEHLHAGFGDAGFYGQWTFELYNPSKRRIILYPGEIYCQMVLSQLDKTTALSYRITGRYNGQTGPTPGRVKHNGV